MSNVTARRAFLNVPPSLERIRAVSEWLQEHVRNWGAPVDVVDRLDLCLNEALANALTHGGPSVHVCPLELHLHYAESQDQHTIVLTLQDGGMAFDPTQAQVRPRARSLQDASPGGLGIQMMRSHSDDLQYHRFNNKNQLDILVRWKTDFP